MTATPPPTLVETFATGGRTMPLSMTVTEPIRACSGDQLEASMLLGSGLNVPFIAGTLSGFLAHERAGANLYRVAAEHSENPMLVAKYGEFGRETVEHIAIYEQLISDLGGDPHYVSPAARMVEQQGAKLLEAPVLLAGSVDLVSLETAFLEAVVIAEHKCHDNWVLLATLADSLPDDAALIVRAAVEKVEPQEDEHIRWATDTWLQLATTNAEHPAANAALGLVERAAHKIKDALS
jgi:rubrerythrin